MNVLTGIITARALTVDGRGELALTQNWPILATYICDLGITPALAYFVARTEVPPGTQWVRQCFKYTVVILGLSAPVAIAGVVFQAAQNQHGSSLLVNGLVFGALYLPTAALQRLLLAVLQGSSKFDSLNLVRLATPATTLSMLAVLASTGSIDVLSACLALVGGQVAGIIIALAAILRIAAKTDHRRAPYPTTRETMGYGVRAHLGSMSPIDGIHLDIIVLGLFLSSYDAGIYAVAVAPGSVVRAAASALGIVVLPRLARHEQKAVEARLYVRSAIARGLGVTAALTVIVVAAMPIMLPVLYGVEFSPAVYYAQALAVASAISGVRIMVGDILRALGKPSSASWAELVSLIFTAAGLFLLVPSYGLAGAVISVFIAYGVSLIYQLIALVQWIRSIDGPDKR